MSFDTLGIISPHPPIMVPEVGGADAKATAASAAAQDKAGELLERFAPDTVVLMSPHAPLAYDGFIVTCAPRLRGDLSQFRAPGASIDTTGDQPLGEAIVAAANSAGVPAVCRVLEGRHTAGLDHGVLVPMYFLDRGHSWPLVVLSLSYLGYVEHRAFGRAVREAASHLGRRVAFVASGDCSHRLKPSAPSGYSPDARVFDEQLVEAVGAGDFARMRSFDEALVERAGECGLRSFVTLGGFLEGTNAAPRVLAYEDPWGVGYLSAVFADPEIAAELGDGEAAPLTTSADEEWRHDDTPETGRKGGSKGRDESEIVRLARDTIERCVRGEVPAGQCVLSDAALPDRAGAFVSLHERGELRGCIGTIAATQHSLADEVAHNAVQACLHDPRFPAVTTDELDGLDIKVDVLHKAERVTDLSELDPTTYGVIVSSGWRRGLLLPDLEGVDTVEQQIDIARRKAGISPGEPVEIERFKVDRYE